MGQGGGARDGAIFWLQKFHLVGILGSSKTEEVRQMEEVHVPVELPHAVLDVRWEIEAANKCDGRGLLQDLSHFESEHGAVAVSREGVGPLGLVRADSGHVAGDCFSDAGESGLVGLEASCAKGVDQPGVRFERGEVVREIEKDEHLYRRPGG